MRVKPWVAQLYGDAFLKPFRDEMFEPLRFLMNLFDRVVEHFMEKSLDEAMVAQDLQRTALARGDRSTPRCFSYSTKGDGEEASFCNILVTEAGATPSRTASDELDTRRFSGPLRARIPFR